MKRSLAGFVAIADEPTDDDDVRLRKRVGVVAGYATILAPLTLPIQAQGHPASIVLGVALSLFSIANLVVLARDRQFDAYVVRLLGAGVVFVPLATAIAGGMTGASPGQVWAFLVPAYAIMALGPRRATRWFLVFLGGGRRDDHFGPDRPRDRPTGSVSDAVARARAKHAAAPRDHLPAALVHGRPAAAGRGSRR